MALELAKTAENLELIAALTTVCFKPARELAALQAALNHSNARARLERSSFHAVLAALQNRQEGLILKHRAEVQLVRAELNQLTALLDETRQQMVRSTCDGSSTDSARRSKRAGKRRQHP